MAHKVFQETCSCTDNQAGRAGLSDAREYLKFNEDGILQVDESLAQEEDICIVFDNGSKLFGNCTPIELEDYAVGMAIDGEIISGIDELASLEYYNDNGLWVIELHTKPELDLDERFAYKQQRDVTPLFKGRPDFSTELSEPYRYELPVQHKVTPEFIWGVNKEFHPLQTLNALCGSTHAAAFVSWSGEFLFVREDVARHSALTKLIGACVRNGIAPDEGFVFLSSRCAVELAVKIARFGVELVATVSAPTLSTAAFAEQVGLTVASYARDTRFTVYAHPERIEGYK